MAITSRCPSCAAAVPNGAAWCSLCHADLRPKPQPALAAPTSTVLPSSSAADQAAGGSAVALAEPMADTSAGRHARPEEPAPAPAPTGGRAAARRAAEREPVGRREAGRSASGRREAGRRSSPVRTAPDPALLEGLELPQGEATPEQAEALAEAMLTRLAVQESGQSLPSPDDFPGGRWAAAAAGLVVVLLVLLLLYAVVGAILD
ncbi:MAG: hypothetical protein LCI03_00695 [Actinobacteria bacterium]|nr:hypothetical protein [Actinomycetota bacterium]